MRARTLVISGAAVAVVTLAAGCGGGPAAHLGEAADAGAGAAAGSAPPAHRNAPAPASTRAATAPPAPGTQPPAPGVLTCVAIGSVLRPVVSDMNAQDQAFAKIVGTGQSLSAMQDMAARAWTNPGAYSGALDNFIAAEGGMTPDSASDPDQLSGDVASVVGLGTTVQQDVEGVNTGQPMDQAWPQFQQWVVAVANDCGVAIATPWS